MKKNVFSKKSNFALTAAILAATPSFSQAEVTLEEVVVMATKRAESIQDVPVSVSAVSAEMMKAMGVTDMAQVSAYIPNFEVSDTGIVPNLYVRGIGSGTTHSIEQSVGRFVDDVYIGRAVINLHGFMDMASVEVLRGPQGTLFGKNTLAGAMIMHTANPTDAFSMGFDVTESAYSTVGGVRQFEGFVSGALTDTLRARLVYQWKEKEGYIENNLSGPDGGTRDDTGARLKLEWDASDDTTVSLKLDYMEFQEEGQNTAETVGGIFPAGPFAGSAIPESYWHQWSPDLTYVGDWTLDIDCDAVLDGETFCPDRDQYSQNVTLTVDHEISGLGTITSVSAFQAYEYNNKFVALDNGAYGGGNRATRDEEFESYSQEIRLTSELFDQYDYIVGAYLEQNDLTRLQPSDLNVPTFFGMTLDPAMTGVVPNPPFYTEREDWDQETESIALFGQLRWHLTDEFTTIVGGRWSYESKDFHLETARVPYHDDPNLVVDEVFDESRSESKFTPSLTVRWEPNADLMLFASIAQGHKTGGFSDRPQVELEFDAETNTAFELGLKGLWLGGSLETNISLYHMAVEDMQVGRSVPGITTGFEVQNAAKATSQGVEFDGRWLFADSWILGANFAYSDATYDDFPGAKEGCPEVGGTLAADGLCNYEGVPLIFAPEYKATVFIEYATDSFIGAWGVRSRIDANFSDDYYMEINYNELLHQDSYATYNASVRFTSPDGKYAVGLVGKNLTEEYVMAFGATGGFTEFVAPNTPREIALQFSYSY